MKLKLEHLAPYLPYGLRAKLGDKTADMHVTFEMICGSDIENVPCFRKHSRDKYPIKPILHPLFDLTKEITVDGEKFKPFDSLYKLSDYTEYLNSLEEQDNKYDLYTPSRWPYELFEKLLEWRFDVFGLIKSGLAIDVNTLKVNPY